jgi:hypothetical protein
MQAINIFPKTPRFCTIPFNQANHVCQTLRNSTANYILCFLNKKTNIHVNFVNVLWVAFSILSDSLSLLKYHVQGYSHKMTSLTRYKCNPKGNSQSNLDPYYIIRHYHNAHKTWIAFKVSLMNINF